ncbi:hypothetical protein ACFLXC_02035 [Chloroflexota bacterium]
MKRLTKIAQGIGKTVIALFTVVWMPALIWIATGTAVYQKMHEAQTETIILDQALAAGEH